MNIFYQTESRRILYLTQILYAILLSGCLATIDLTKDANPLPEKERRIVREIAQIAPNVCGIFEHYGDYRPVGGARRIVLPIEVKRLYTSPTDWYKVDFAVQGVWGEGYYNDKTKVFICGDKSWAMYSDSQDVRFIEFGKPDNKINQLSR